MMNQTLGSRIAELRRKKNMTQEELAAELGVTPQAVSKWENDLSCPDITLLPQLAQQREPIAVGEHHVQEKQIGIQNRLFCQSLLAIVCRINRKTLFFKIISDNI